MEKIFDKYLRILLSILIVCTFSSCSSEEDDGLLLGDTFISDGIVFMKLSNDPKVVGVEGVVEQREHLSIPRTVTNNKVKYSVICINNGAFDGDTVIMIADLPRTIRRIGAYAFYWCSRLKEVNLSGKSIEIGDYVFYHSAIEEIAIPDGSTLGRGSFARCYSLSKCILPSDLEIIPEDCFLFCSPLENLEIPESVMYIGVWAFNGAKFDPPFYGYRN